MLKYLSAAEVFGDPITLMTAYWVIARKLMKLGEPAIERKMMDKLQNPIRLQRTDLARKTTSSV